jgi:hypothetical protein
MDINTFLNTYDFEPHVNGNYALYGLNLFGGDSIIQYDDKIWLFNAFDQNKAIYETYDGKRMLLSSSTYTDGVQRMQIKAMLSAVH